ncbi:hypothetical protein NVP1278O_53 [Vibrio phage 1.278.O._10N.286.54.E8]|nr:hypothetical protein NVP1278O_53 [Vibrio phage 1.278.O._10N.286.54.E8]
MNEKEEHRIRDIHFKCENDFKRWKWKLIRNYIGKVFALLLTRNKGYIYAAFMMEIQKADSFEELNERYQSKIFKG